MKKQSVLIRRALLFTAIVALVAVAVGLPTLLLLEDHFAVRAAREAVLDQARTLADAAASDALDAPAALFTAMDGGIWLADA